ncbi:hypothetical protein B0A55_06122 [Friedmanniomyces simplex]|uniref:Uncharacterized protein n=1 Tax=Friedmanniomyces simplex TaxID=329884 RepID=A0A4U0X5E3_9PEZI|nr:hypothetical protein B0A55_06122 [Friedmanniomyces simplex]
MLVRLHLALAKGLNVRTGKHVFYIFLDHATDALTLAGKYENDSRGVPVRLWTELDKVGSHFYKVHFSMNPISAGTGCQEAQELARQQWSAELFSRSLRVHKGTEWAGREDDAFLALAICHGLVSYVKRVLVDHPSAVAGLATGLYLQYALHTIWSPHYDMVRLLLNAGANPNQNSTITVLGVYTVWETFITRCYSRPNNRLWPIAGLLLKFKADPRAMCMKMDDEDYGQDYDDD